MSNKITIHGIVVGFNSLQYRGKIINCWINASDSASPGQPLNLAQHEGEVVEVSGVLYTDIWEAKFEKKLDKTKEAKSLRELMRIREDTRETINKSKNLGSALGFKWAMKKNTKRPCIIIFVDKKEKPEEVDEDELAPDVLEDKNGTWCLTDVVAGGESGSVSADSLPELSPENKKVVKALSSKGSDLIGGMRLAFDIGEGEEGWGTAGIAVKTGQDEIGFLTNRHLTGASAREMRHPYLNSPPIGDNYKPDIYSAEKCAFGKWYGMNTGNNNSKVAADYGFIKIRDPLKSKVRPGIYGIGETGPLKRIDIDTMDIIGQRIISVGASRGIQRGTVSAYSYEWKYFGESYYTDILITGEGGDFAFQGDSGKIIVTDDEEHCPIALHWGGVRGQLDNDEGEKQKIWGKATDLGKILDHSGLEIIHKTNIGG
jgi:hypothetical protein